MSISMPIRGRVLIPILAMACGRGEPSGAPIVRDSLGTTVVESRAPRWSDGGGWTLTAPPLLQIGAADGAPEYQFHRVEGALRLDDGRIVVANAGSGEIRWFDAAGEFLGSSGGPGEAPGEYRQITTLGRGPADSLWVFDFGLRRFTVLTGDGEVVRTVHVGSSLSAVGAVGRLPNGDFVVKESWSSGAGDAIRLGLVRNPVAVVRIGVDGTRYDTITTVAGRELFIGTEGGRGVMSSPLFAHTSSAAIRREMILLGDQDRMEVREYTAEGVLNRIFRAPGVDLRLSRADVAAELAQVVAGEPAERRAEARARLESMDVPANRPAFGRLAVDVEGNVWAAVYARIPEVPDAWTVFDAGGALLGRVEFPPNFAVLDLGSDWVLGVGRDDFDVEYVRMYRLDKNASP